MTMDGRDTTNRLKTYITEPTININPKGVKAYQYKNRMNFLMFSNHDDAAKIEKGDRRYFVWRSQAEVRGREYYSALFDWFKHGGAEALAHHLKTRNLDHYDPFAPAPVTAAKLQIIEDSRSPIDAQLQKLFDAGEKPFRHDMVVTSDLTDWLANNRGQELTPQKMGRFLRSIGGYLRGQCRMLDDSKPNVWIIRNHERWVAAPESVIAHCYRRPDEAPAE